MQVTLPAISEENYGKRNAGPEPWERAKVGEGVDAGRLRKACGLEMNGNGSGGDELVINLEAMDRHRHLSESRDVRMNDVATARDAKLPALDLSGTDTSENVPRLGHYEDLL